MSHDALTVEFDSARFNRANEALRHQHEDLYFDRYFSLDSLWRAVGSPAKQDPGTWIGRAAPLIQGLRSYLREMSRDLPLPERVRQKDDPTEIIRVDEIYSDPDLAEAYQLGDRLANWYLAKMYAVYLDSRTAQDAGYY